MLLSNLLQFTKPFLTFTLMLFYILKHRNQHLEFSNKLKHAMKIYFTTIMFFYPQSRLKEITNNNIFSILPFILLTIVAI